MAAAAEEATAAEEAAAAALASGAFDLAQFLRTAAGGEEVAQDVLAVCRAMAEHIHQTGILVVRDPRVSSDDNDTFLQLMQRYYSQPIEDLMEDARPEIFYQVGVTPERVETAVCAHEEQCKEEIAAMPEEHRPLQPRGPDPKWRFFWRIGDRPDAADTKFAELNAPAVVPKAFADEWASTMDGWGGKILAACQTVAEMLALGFGEPRDSFTSRMHLGPHLLAPTGGDLAKYTDVGTIFAGWHADLNFLTIHGKSNFPGLSVWTREGTKMRVKVPPGCLLVQAGKQLEHLTGGHVRAGFHEVVRSLAVPVPTPSPAPALEPAPAPEPASADVTALTCRESGAVERGYIVTVRATTVAAADHGLVCCDGTQVLTDATREAAAKAKAEGKSCWRISSTMFTTLCHDSVLEPVGRWKHEPTASQYPPILTGDQVAGELKKIGMAAAAMGDSAEASM